MIPRNDATRLRCNDGGSHKPGPACTGSTRPVCEVRTPVVLHAQEHGRHQQAKANKSEA